jgi:hypothetical protein
MTRTFTAALNTVSSLSLIAGLAVTSVSASAQNIIHHWPNGGGLSPRADIIHHWPTNDLSHLANIIHHWPTVTARTAADFNEHK